MRYDVVALGELLIDFAEQGHGVDQYPIMAAHPGGAPANCLAALTACGKKRPCWEKWGRICLVICLYIHCARRGLIRAE